ncbi:EamA family transporter [Rhizobium cauense]|uniref:DMT family transporter n=1 Tax=Rhizobium cauense TaxID=1166683 RepID=UPI001C6F3457|nr:EamA family transporter [Rhizobium cauense]MBW9113526.1 EamA family transporter [Rhizobium cauense]
MPSINTTKFLVLCLVWGLTWIGVKAGIQSVPPIIFAATRFIAAGLILLAYGWTSGSVHGISTKDISRLLCASLLMITFCYGPLFWGMQFIASGTAAVLEMSLTPLALLAFGFLLGQEVWNWRRVVAMAVGTLGLVLLFEHTATRPEVNSMTGAVAVSVAALSSALGSVIARPLIARYGSVLISGSTTFLGGAMLLLFGLASGDSPRTLVAFLWPWSAIGGWLFLIFFGSVAGYSLYLQLLRDIGPARAGSFAFVSPVIAVIVGVIVAGETVAVINIVGMVLLLFAAGVCLYAGKTEEKGVGQPEADLTPLIGKSCLASQSAGIRGRR